MSLDGGRKKLLAALGAFGAALLSLAIYRRFFASQNKSLEDSNKRDNESVVSEAREVSPPYNFKTNDQAIENDNDAVDTLMEEVTLAEGQEARAREEPNVASSSTVFTGVRPAHDSSAALISDQLTETHESRTVEEGKSADVQLSPPVDFKIEETILPSASVPLAQARLGCNSFAVGEHSQPHELIGGEPENMPAEISPPIIFKAIDEQMLPSITGIGAVTEARSSVTDKREELDEFDTGKAAGGTSVEVSPPVEFTSRLNDTSAGSPTPIVEEQLVASVTNVSLSSVPVSHSLHSSEDSSSKDSGVYPIATGVEVVSDLIDSKLHACNGLPGDGLPSPQDLSAQLDMIEQNLGLLPKIDFPVVENCEAETVVNMNSSRVSEDSANGLSIADSGVGSAVSNDAAKSSDAQSTSFCVSSDVESVDERKKINGVLNDVGSDVTTCTTLTQMEKSESDAVSDLPASSQTSSEVSTLSSQELGNTKDRISSKSTKEVFEDPSHIIREFYMPETLCGRFIGRGGKNISALKMETRTNIKVGRDLVVPGNKLCIVEGKAQDVKRALRVIQKQYPEVDVSGARPPVTLTLSSNLMQLNLPTGVLIDVFISHVVSAGHVFVQQPTHPTFSSWQQLNGAMNRSYADLASTAPPLPSGVEGDICVTPWDGQWHRAQIISITEDKSNCELKLMDIGGYVSVPMTALRQINAYFLRLPFQATECYLANISPLPEEGDNYSQEAAEVFKSLIAKQVVQCQSVAVDSHNSVPYIHIISQVHHKAVVVNKELANRGLVQWYDMAP